MPSLNKCMIIGHLGKDPEVRYTQDGTPVANFSLATTERWKDKSGEKREQTTWLNIVAWKGLAELCKNYTHKGSLILVEGKIQNRKWEDKEGNPRYTTEIVANGITLLDRKPADNPVSQPEEVTPIDEEDPIPF